MAGMPMLPKCNMTLNIRIQLSVCRVKLTGIHKVDHQTNPGNDLIGLTVEITTKRKLGMKLMPSFDGVISLRREHRRRTACQTNMSSGNEAQTRQFSQNH